MYRILNVSCDCERDCIIIYYNIVVFMYRQLVSCSCASLLVVCISTEFGYAEFSGNAYLFLESCNRLLCAAYCCTFVSPVRPVLIGVYIIVAYSLHGAPVYMSLTHSLM